jgi:hypothetical protein
LYGPSLSGYKILLPVDLLALPGYYLPATPEYADIEPHDATLADEVLLFEFERRFATREFRAGRLPLWIPDIGLGAPYVVWEKYSPFNVLYYLFPWPVTLAWIQLLKSIVAGWGAYCFFRRVLDVGFWPAAIGAWCYPLTGFFTLWQGYPHTSVTAWFPWLLLATDYVVRRPLGWGGPALAILTCTAIVTRIDVAGQALLACGLFALWCLWDEHQRQPGFRRTFSSAAAVAAAWILGFALSAPYVLPFMEYSLSSDRLSRRGAGQEERPPVGLIELPRIVLPDTYGSSRFGEHLTAQGNLLESGAASYTGLLATLVMAPLACCSQRRRSLNIFWIVLGALALAWLLNIPGLVSLFRIPGVNLFSHNRFVFAASFAILALAVTGIEVVWQGNPARRWWFALPTLLLLMLGVWCWDRSTWLPEPLATQLHGAIQRRQAPPNVPDLAALDRAKAHYVQAQRLGAVLCGLGVAVWILIWFRMAVRPWCQFLIGGLLIGELLWFARDRNPQCDPALYYPHLPLLDRLAEAPAGRVLGFGCLPANLSMAPGLRDIRGYDSIDPKPLTDLLEPIRDPRSQPVPYARLQWYAPRILTSEPGKWKLPPVLSMLSVRYLIFRGTPPPDIHPFMTAADYWALENTDALPRAFVPRRVEKAPKTDRLIELLTASNFDPNTVYVEGDFLADQCRGSAAIVAEAPTQVVIQADMETDGFVVLSDMWFPGWHASVNGTEVPILRANHALRGIRLSPGKSTIVFRYQPASFAWGLWLTCSGVAILGGWTWTSVRWRRHASLTVSQHLGLGGVGGS